jgi:biopolymer transport protein ExbD
LDFDRDRREPIELNITPLIDIVFLLLIFFLLTSHFFTEQGLQVQLPGSRTGQKVERAEIVVSLDDQERLSLNDEPVAWAELEDKLRAMLAREPAVTVLLKADRSVRLDRAVTLMDTAKAAGAQKLVLATTPQPIDGNETLKAPSGNP